MILVQDLFEHLSDFFWKVSEMIICDTGEEHLQEDLFSCSFNRRRDLLEIIFCLSSLFPQ